MGETAFLDLKEGLRQKDLNHAPHCYQGTVDGILVFEVLAFAYYAKDSGRNEVEAPEQFHSACLWFLINNKAC